MPEAATNNTGVATFTGAENSTNEHLGTKLDKSREYTCTAELTLLKAYRVLLSPERQHQLVAHLLNHLGCSGKVQNMPTNASLLLFAYVITLSAIRLISLAFGTVVRMRSCLIRAVTRLLHRVNKADFSCTALTEASQSYATLCD